MAKPFSPYHLFSFIALIMFLWIFLLGFLRKWRGDHRKYEEFNSMVIATKKAVDPGEDQYKLKITTKRKKKNCCDRRTDIDDETAIQREIEEKKEKIHLSQVTADADSENGGYVRHKNEVEHHFSWLKMLWNYSQSDVINSVGLDAAIYLQYMKYFTLYFGVTSICSAYMVQKYYLVEDPEINNVSHFSIVIALNDTSVKWSFYIVMIIISLIDHAFIVILKREENELIKSYKEPLKQSALKVFGSDCICKRAQGCLVGMRSLVTDD